MRAILRFSCGQTLVLLLVLRADLGWGPQQREAHGQDAPVPVSWHVPRSHNRWARFEPGAWKTVRTETETFDESGQVVHTSLAIATTTLVAVDTAGYRLKTSRTVQVDGKRMSALPQTLEYDMFDQAGSPATVVWPADAGSVQVDGQTIPSQVYRLETSTDTGRELTTLHYAADVPPHVLRQHSRWMDASGKITVDELTAEIAHLHLRRRVLGTPLWTAEKKTIRHNRKGMTITVSYLCDDIPGGVVNRLSTEFDSAGKVVRCSDLELIGYGCRSASIRMAPQIRPHRRLRRRR